MQPAVDDTYWLEADELYYATGDEVPIDRPVYQGDIYADVPLPVIQGAVPDGNEVKLSVVRTPVMIVPHPCQCYHGDTLRSKLTVAPIKAVEVEIDSDAPGQKDKFALLDLPRRTEDGTWTTQTSVADFGRLVSVPQRWIVTGGYRVACLSHKGLGLLAKRMTDFQLRQPITLNNAMSFTAKEWYEAFLMQAWVRKHRSLKGYSAWMRTPIQIVGVGAEGEWVTPYSVRTSGYDALMELITGEPLVEPGDEATSPSGPSTEN